MISDNILKWYTDEIIRNKYNVLGWALTEKQIKEDKTKLVFETSNTKLSIEFKKLSETTIIFNNIVCKEEKPKTKINGIEYYLEEAVWEEIFHERILTKGTELENMTMEEIAKEAIGCIDKALQRMIAIKTNNNMSLFKENKEKDMEEAEIVEDNKNLIAYKDEIDEAEIVEEEE